MCACCHWLSGGLPQRVDPRSCGSFRKPDVLLRSSVIALEECPQHGLRPESVPRTSVGRASAAALRRQSTAGGTQGKRDAIIPFTRVTASPLRTLAVKHVDRRISQCNHPPWPSHNVVGAEVAAPAVPNSIGYRTLIVRRARMRQFTVCRTM